MGGLSGTILVVNVGSTSVKLAAFVDDLDSPEWQADTEVPPARGSRTDALAAAIGACPLLSDVRAVGHRIVHGGMRFDRPVVVDDEVESAIGAAAEFAPLHNRAGLDGIAAARLALGARPQVAVFDTAFHRTIPPAAAVYGGPHAWFARGLRRYGFHGISHEDAARRASELLGRRVDALRLLTCHLGGGCSVTAVDGGRSVDTTMGLTPLEGLIMATRAGSIDPALVLHLLREGQSIDAVHDTLEHGSGLAGLSGISADLREVVAARDAGNERAALAIDAFVHRTASGVGAMAAALGSVDGVVFTGGIGEHSAEVRARVGAQLSFLGVAIDETANEECSGDAVVSPDDASAAVVVVVAREEAAIARAVAGVLG